MRAGITTFMQSVLHKFFLIFLDDKILLFQKSAIFRGVFHALLYIFDML